MSQRDGDIAMAIFASYVLGQFMPLFYRRVSPRIGPNYDRALDKISLAGLFFKPLRSLGVWAK